MNKVKITIIGIVLICFIGITNAQMVDRNGSLPTKADIETEPVKSSVVTYEVKMDAQQLENDLVNILKKEVINQSVNIKSNLSTQSVSLCTDTAKVKIAEIENFLYKKKYILLEQENNPSVELQSETKSVTATEKYDPEIDRFLNSNDTSIFNTNFVDVPDSLIQKKIHPRSQSYYQLIKNIHILDGMLSKKKYDPTSIRPDLDKMEKLIDDINDPGKNPKNLLPDPLLNYYRSMVKKYGEIYDSIYSDK